MKNNQNNSILRILISHISYSDNYAKGANEDLKLLISDNLVHLINLIHPVQTKEMTEVIDELNELLAA